MKTNNICKYSKLLNNNNAIIIQKMYKGYYIRKKLKIYFNLPRDLQRKIIWYINSDLYLRNFNSSISRIIYRRYKEFYNKFFYIFPSHNLNVLIYNPFNIHINSEMYNTAFIDLMFLLKLSIKYYSIIKISKIPYFYNIKGLCVNLIKLYKNPNDTSLSIIQKYINLFH